MRVVCGLCNKTYDDEVRWTLCPHNRLEASPTGDGRGWDGRGYCEEHDLFNCPNHPPPPPPPLAAPRSEGLFGRLSRMFRWP